MAGRTPALQQNWQSSEKSQHFKEKTTIFNKHPVGALRIFVHTPSIHRFLNKNKATKSSINSPVLITKVIVCICNDYNTAAKLSFEYVA